MASYEIEVPDEVLDFLTEKGVSWDLGVVIVSLIAASLEEEDDLRANNMESANRHWMRYAGVEKSGNDAPFEDEGEDETEEANNGSDARRVLEEKPNSKRCTECQCVKGVTAFRKGENICRLCWKKTETV